MHRAPLASRLDDDDVADGTRYFAEDRQSVCDHRRQQPRHLCTHNQHSDSPGPTGRPGHGASSDVISFRPSNLRMRGGGKRAGGDFYRTARRRIRCPMTRPTRMRSRGEAAAVLARRAIAPSPPPPEEDARAHAARSRAQGRYTCSSLISSLLSKPAVDAGENSLSPRVEKSAIE